MAEEWIELQVDFPGKEYARVDYDLSSGDLKLLEIVHPEVCLPVDLCNILSTRTEEDTSLPAILFCRISLPPGCRVTARPIGIFLADEKKNGQPVILCVPTSDSTYGQVSSFYDLPEPDQNQIKEFLQSNGNGYGNLSIQDKESAWTVISTAQKKHRIYQTKHRKHKPLAPAWQPGSSPLITHITGESERYTESEYQYWQLPRRFQKYIEEYLQPNERILSSLHRPMMRSALYRDFLTGRRLQESVLIISDRQITLVEEKIPPNQSDVHYGYIAHSNAPERLICVETLSLSQDVIGLRLGFQGTTGVQQVTFEFPSFFREKISQTAALLSAWLPTENDHRLRRATLQNIPETKPPLTDPASNDPETTKLTSQRYESLLSDLLAEDEHFLDWCLFPLWLPGADVERVLAITSKRLILISEKTPLQPALEIPHHQVASIEFCSTYMDSHLTLFIPQGRRVREETIYFSKTMAAMERCFHVLQQAIAVAPLAEITNGVFEMEKQYERSKQYGS